MRFGLPPSGSIATYGLAGAAIAVYVISWMMKGALLEPLAFWVDGSHLWGLVTYPFASAGSGQFILWFLVEIYWLYWVGASAESALGAGKYLAFFFVSSALAAIFVWIGAIILGIHYAGGPILAGLELPLAALTVAWGVRHRSQSILLMFIIPVQGMVLVWLTLAFVLFRYGSILENPIMGLFASLHLGAAYLFADNRIPNLPFRRGSSRDESRRRKEAELRDAAFREDVRQRKQERAERERLRRLFEGSMTDDGSGSDDEDR